MFKKLFSNQSPQNTQTVDPVTRAACKACEGSGTQFLRTEYGPRNMLTLWFLLGTDPDVRWEYGVPVLTSLFDGKGDAFVVPLLREYIAAARAKIWENPGAPRVLTLPAGRGTLRRI